MRFVTDGKENGSNLVHCGGELITKLILLPSIQRAQCKKTLRFEKIITSMMICLMTIMQLEDYPRPTSLSFEKLKEEGEGEEGAVLYVPSKGVTLQVAFFTIKINFEF